MKKIILFVSFILATTTVFAQTLADAIKQTQNEQYETANESFAKLLAANPNSGEVYFYWGENYFNNENLVKAEAMYKKGTEVNATEPLCQVGQGKILWYKENKADANKAFYDAKALVGKKEKIKMVQVKMAIAKAYINAPNKELIEAETLLKQCSALTPQNADIYVLMGDVYLEKNLGTKAIENYEKAEQLDKTAVKAILRQGQVFNRAQNYNLALELYSKASLIDSSYAPAYREKAEIYFRAGQYDNATAQFKRYLELNNNCSAQGRYAGFLNKAKKYEESINAATEAIKCNPEKAFTYRYKGRSEYEAGKYAEGLATMNTFFELAEKNPSMKIIADDYVYRAKLYHKNELDSLAIIEFKKALAIDSNDIKLNREIGKLFMKMKSFDEAITVYQNNIATGKHNANDHFGLGRAHYYGKDFVKADSAFTQITKSNPSLALGYLWKARANAQQDPKNETWLAKPHYEKLITIIEAGDIAKNKKTIIEAYTYMGVYYMNNKEMCTAKPYFEKVADLDTENTNAKKFLLSAEAKKCP